MDDTKILASGGKAHMGICNTHRRRTEDAQQNGHSEVHLDHIDRDHDHNHLSNKMLLHRHCHDERHAKHLEAEKRLRLAAAGINIQ